MVMNAVHKLAEAMREVPQVQIDTQHHLVNGIYARTTFIPAGVVGTGCTHKTDHISILVGDATLTLEDSVERLTGYNVLATKTGMTRAILAHSDCWLTTICKTEFSELADIENGQVEEAQTLQTQNPSLTQNKLILIGD
jgi:hypothetical protein